VFGTELYSGKTVCYGRYQFEGAIIETYLPKWAKIKLEIMQDKEIFEFGGYHFKPVRQFMDNEINKQLHTDSRPWKEDAHYAMRNMASDFSLGISSYDRKKTEAAYSVDAFYAASGDSTADIFRCIENDKLYVPGENELFRYNEPPQKEQANSRTDRRKDEKPDFLAKINGNKQKVEQDKAGAGTPAKNKKRDGQEV
jgi:hypothetical protein